MRDLDRRAPGDRITIEAQEPMTAERVEHGPQQLPIDVKILELAPEHTAARVLPTVGEGHEAEEHLTGNFLDTEPRLVNSPSARLTSAPDTPLLRVRDVVDAIAVTAIKQLRQGVLQQWQGTRSIAHLADQFGDERRLEPHSLRFRRTVIARSSSCGHIGVMTSVPSRSSSPSPRRCNGWS